MAAAGKIAGAITGGYAEGMTEQQQKWIKKGQQKQMQAGREAEEMHQPWAETGRRSMQDLYKMAQGDWDFEADPGYEFRLGEGSKAVTRGSIGTGSPYSGATMKALTRYNQDFASNEYGRAYGRREGTLGQLAYMGQTATGEMGRLRTGAADDFMAGQMAKSGVYTDAQNQGMDIIGAGAGWAAGKYG